MAPASHPSPVDVPSIQNATDNALQHVEAIRALEMMPSEAPAPAGDGRQHEILTAAMTAFADRGFDACTMRDIAAVVGVKAPAIYHHFSSKETLLEAAVRSALAVFYWRVLEPLAAETVDERLEGVVRRHVRFQLEEGELARANDTLLRSGTIGRVLPPKASRRITDSLHHYVEVVRMLVRTTVPADAELDDLVAAFAVANICDGVSAWQRTHAIGDPGAIEDHVWMIVRSMLRVRG